MTFSVNSVKVASEMPVESEFLPMVNLYYVLGITYVFLAFNWFIIAERFLQKKRIPKFLVKCALLSKRCFFWKFDKTTLRAKGEHVSLGLNSQSSSKERIFETSSIKSAASEIFPKDHRESCFNCDFCENCLRVKETEKENMSTKGENDSNVSALNNCMCFILFVVMLASNLITWSFAYYPKSNL